MERYLPTTRLARATFLQFGTDTLCLKKVTISVVDMVGNE